MKKKLVITFFMLVLAMGIAGCGEAGSVDTPTATPEVTDTPTLTPTARPTSTPTFTPSPSPTPMPYTSVDTVYPWIYTKYGCEKYIASIVYYDENGEIIEEITSDPNAYELKKIPKYATCFNAEKQQICTVIYDYNCEDTEGLQAYKYLSTKGYPYFTKFFNNDGLLYNPYYGRCEKMAMTCTYVEYDPSSGAEYRTFKKYIYASIYNPVEYNINTDYDTWHTNTWYISKLEIEDGENIKTYSHFFEDMEIYDFWEDAVNEEFPEFFDTTVASEYGKQERPETQEESLYFENGTLLDSDLNESLKKLSALTEGSSEDDLSYNGIYAMYEREFSLYYYYSWHEICAYVNLETGQRLTLADLFYEDVNYVELINNEIKQYNLTSKSGYRHGYSIEADQPFYIESVKWTDEDGNENVALYLVIMFINPQSDSYSVYDGFTLDPIVFAANGSFNVVDPEKVFEAGTYEVKKVTYPEVLTPNEDYGFKPELSYSETLAVLCDFAKAENVGDKYNFIFRTATDTDISADIWDKYLIKVCADASSDLVNRLFTGFDELVAEEEADKGEFVGSTGHYSVWNKIFQPGTYTYPLNVYVNVQVESNGEETTEISFEMGTQGAFYTAERALITITVDNDSYKIIDIKTDKKL